MKQFAYWSRVYSCIIDTNLDIFVSREKKSARSFIGAFLVYRTLFRSRSLFSPLFTPVFTLFSFLSIVPGERAKMNLVFFCIKLHFLGSQCEYRYKQRAEDFYGCAAHPCKYQLQHSLLEFSSLWVITSVEFAIYNSI